MKEMLEVVNERMGRGQVEELKFMDQLILAMEQEAKM